MYTTNYEVPSTPTSGFPLKNLKGLRGKGRGKTTGIEYVIIGYLSVRNMLLDEFSIFDTVGSTGHPFAFT